MVVALATSAWLLLASGAEAFVYWANSNGGALTGTTIGRANLNGTGINQNFITGGQGVCGVAVTDSFIFWGNDNAGSGTSIGRANIDGSSPSQTFVTSANGPCVGDTDATYVYWSNLNDDTLGRATFNASTVNPAFVNPASDLPCGVAVNPTDVYWANQLGDAIGRALISGANPNPTFLPLSATSNPCGVAVNSAHIYWGEFDNGTIGRANLDGSGLKENFISGLGKPCGVAVTDTHIYWSDSSTSTIGRANLDGTGVNPSFITGAIGPCGVAVDDKVLPSSTALSCERSASAFNQPTTCTATVTDIGPPVTATPPAGTVSFSSASGGAGFSGGSSCTLSPAGAGSSRCSVTYLPGTGINLLQGIYSGDPTAHSGSSAVTQLTVSGFSISSVVLNPADGTATVFATVPGPGTVSLQGAGVLPTSAGAPSAGGVIFTMSPDAQNSALLNRTGSAPISAIVNYTPQGGGASASQPLSLTLQKTLKSKKHKRKKHKGKKHKRKKHKQR
jgi:hypothetical protein